MKLRLKSAIAGTAVFAVAGAGLLAFGAPANAAAPVWEPDGHAAGTIVLYDASGNVVTGGSDLTNLAAYAVASTPGASGTGLKAQLSFAAPSHASNDTASWFSAPASGSTAYPVAAAPAPLSGTAATNKSGVAFTNPVASLGTTGSNLQNFMSSATPDTTAGYNNIWQLQLSATSFAKTWTADVLVNPSAGTWQIVYPNFVTPSTIQLTSTPANGGNKPASSATGTLLSAAVTTVAGGTGVVQFFDGATKISQSAVTADGTGAATATFTTAVGAANSSHAYSAQFFPNGGVDASPSAASSSSTVTYTNDAVATTTAAAAPTTGAQYAPVSLTATITEADAPTTAGLDGTVTFLDGGSSIGTSTTHTLTGTTNAVYTFTANFATQGVHHITASYNPTISSYSASTPTFYSSSADSTNHDITISAPACGHGGTPGGDGTTYSGIDCQQSNNIDAIVDVGSLTLTTPYTTALGNTFHFGHLKLDSTGSFFTSGNMSFPAAADAPIIVHSSLASNPNWTLSVSATDLQCQVGAAPGNCAATDKISGAGLGLTAGQVVTSGTTPDNTKLYGASANGAAGPTLHPGLAYPILPSTELVAFTDIPAHQPVAGDTNHGLLAGASPWTFAQTITDSSHTGGNGSVAIRGTIVLDAPSNTLAGLYAGAITFLVN